LPKHILRQRALSPQTPRTPDWSFRHDRQSGRHGLRSQPLTRRLRRHPLPQGERLGQRR
jgi:hypothetical protein